MTGSTTLSDRWENWCPQRGRSLPRLHSVEICAWRNLSAVLKVLSGGTIVLPVFLFFRKPCGCRKEFLFPYIPSGLFKGKSEQVCIYLVNMSCCLKPNVVYTDDNLGKRGLSKTWRILVTFSTLCISQVKNFSFCFFLIPCIGTCSASGQTAFFMQPENSESLFLVVSINLQFHNGSNGAFYPMF